MRPAVAHLVGALVGSLMGILTVPVCSAKPCAFNPLCMCNDEIVREIVCVSVPFSVFPGDLGDCENGEVTMARSGLEVLQNDSLSGTRLSTLRLMHNSLSRIYACAFCGAEDTLVSLDLSHNVLKVAPLHQIRRLRHLQWLNLQSNRIEDLKKNEWEDLSKSVYLRSLFLGDNRLRLIRDGVLKNFSNLLTLELDRNLITDLSGSPFPPSLSRLNLANNLLEHVPQHALENLVSLTSLFLGGNLLKTLPDAWFLPTRHMDQLDLSRNMIDHLPEKLFNNSVFLKDLHLEFNFLTQLPEGLFGSVSIERLSLANNRLSFLAQHLFGGLESILVVLDLSFNLFRHFPAGVKRLTSLTMLYLRGNLLSSLAPEDISSFGGVLEALDLSGNKFVRVPKSALRNAGRLSRLSLQDNHIQDICSDDFQSWGRNLTTLSLANNGIRTISNDVFVHLSSLKELKLSFNNIEFLDYQVFLPLRNTLEVLELSSSLGQRFFPLELVRHMKRVQWLQLDHNQMVNLTDSYLQGLPSLTHFDLEGNRIGRITSNFFKENIHERLNRIVLAHNELVSIDTGTFKNLSRLANVVLLGNKINSLRTRSFQGLPRLHTIVLSRNRIEHIEAGAFSALPKLSNLLLQDNNLTFFSLECLYKSGSESLLLNLSQNSIMDLRAGTSGWATNETTYGLHTLDISRNRLSYVNDRFLESIGQSLLNLYLSNNNLENVDRLLVDLGVLQTLHLDHNRLCSISFNTFRDAQNLQVLALGKNNITVIGELAFGNMSKLRILDLSHNGIRDLPGSAFDSTPLERLNLSFNDLPQCPSSALRSVKRTLRVLDLTENKISSLGPGDFEHLTNLLVLNVSRNQITVIADDAFMGLGQLMHLDLSHSLLFNIKKASFLPLKTLETLNLKNCSLTRLAALPLRKLASLDVSENFLFNVSSESFQQLKNLRSLYLSWNLLEGVPHHLWELIPLLQSLDLHNNPIVFLNVDSFSGLRRLRELDIRHLQLRSLDSRSLHELKSLTILRTTTYAAIRSFRLQELVSQVDSLRRVLVEVEEPVLSHQLQWAFGAKLSELTVTGRKLRVIFPDALLGLHSTHELVLRLTGTSIRRLPAGLLRYLADVRYLTLDLRGNLLFSMGPEVLRPTGDQGFWRGTQHLAGGVRLEGNPWVCDCQLLWLSQWLRRWLRETLRVQMLHFDAAIYVHNQARQSECAYPRTYVRMPIIDLQEQDLQCTSAATSAEGMTLQLLTFMLLVSECV